jgi:hypothetical protein
MGSQLPARELPRLVIEPAEEAGIFAPNVNTHSTWGASIVKDRKTGLYHIFAAHWQGGLMSWSKDSTIVRGVSEYPWGPWKYVEKLDALTKHPTGDEMVHGPEVQYRQEDETYYLIYRGVGSGAPWSDGHGGLCVAKAKSPEGPWVVSEKSPILPYSVSKPRCSYLSGWILNGAFWFDENEVKLYFKTGRYHVGLATAPSPEGPYTFSKRPALPRSGEDPCVWEQDGAYYLLTTHDFGVSYDGGLTFKRIDDRGAYAPIVWAEGHKPPRKGGGRGPDRPKVFMEDGRVVAISVAQGAGGTTYNITRRCRLETGKPGEPEPAEATRAERDQEGKARPGVLINKYDLSGDGPNEDKADTNIRITGCSSVLKNGVQAWSTISGIHRRGRFAIGFRDASPGDGTFSDGKFADADGDGTPEVTAMFGSGWATADRHAEDSWIAYDLDAVYSLDHMLVWNYNQDVHTDWGVKETKVYVSTNASPTLPSGACPRPGNHADWTQVGSTFTLAKAPGANTYGNGSVHPNSVPDSLELGGATARHVLLDIEGNHGSWGTGRVGIGEVQFYGAPVARPATEKEE